MVATYVRISTLDIWGFIDWALNEIEKEKVAAFGDADSRVTHIPDASKLHYWGMTRAFDMLSSHLAELEDDLYQIQNRPKEMKGDDGDDE